MKKYIVKCGMWSCLHHHPTKQSCNIEGDDILITENPKAEHKPYCPHYVKRV